MFLLFVEMYPHLLNQNRCLNHQTKTASRLNDPFIFSQTTKSYFSCSFIMFLFQVRLFEFLFQVFVFVQ